MTAEKRKHVRIHSLNLSHVSLEDADEPVKQSIGRTLNVSESGILLETHFPIPLDQSISLTIGLEEDLVEIRGKVVHLLDGEKGKYEMGIEFTRIDDQASDVLRRYIQAFNEMRKQSEP
ncbi:MAG: PilZ domain-containing protein [Desulfobacterales bacterium]